MDMTPLENLLPLGDQVRIQRKYSEKMFVKDILNQPPEFFNEKIAVSGALFKDGRRFKGFNHGDVCGFWGCAIDLDHPNKSTGGYFSREDVEKLFQQIPADLQPYATVVHSNGVTIWFKFDKYAEVSSWADIAYSMEKLGKHMEMSQIAKWDNTYTNSTGEPANQANHAYRLPLSLASSRNTPSETTHQGSPISLDHLINTIIITTSLSVPYCTCNRMEKKGKNMGSPTQETPTRNPHQDNPSGILNKPSDIPTRVSKNNSLILTHNCVKTPTNTPRIAKTSYTATKNTPTTRHLSSTSSREFIQALHDYKSSTLTIPQIAQKYPTLQDKTLNCIKIKLKGNRL